MIEDTQLRENSFMCLAMIAENHYTHIGAYLEAIFPLSASAIEECVGPPRFVSARHTLARGRRLRPTLNITYAGFGEILDRARWIAGIQPQPP